MNADDLREVVNYFRAEGRDPYETELRILDTYWSDHCRHTTFTTGARRRFAVDESFMPRPRSEESLALYHAHPPRTGPRATKALCLMDLATIGARYLRKNRQVGRSGGVRGEQRLLGLSSTSTWTDSPKSGCCSSRTRRTTTPPRSNPSAALRPVWAARSATRCRGAATSTRPCV